MYRFCYCTEFRYFALAYFDKRIAPRLEPIFVATVFRYVHDYLIILKGVEPLVSTLVVDSVIDVFRVNDMDFGLRTKCQKVGICITVRYAHA